VPTYENDMIVRENIVDRCRTQGYDRGTAERLADGSIRRVSRDINDREAGRDQGHQPRRK